MSKPILKIKNLNVEYPLFGGVLQRETIISPEKLKAKS